MPKVPRDISGRDLARLLEKHGYGIVRETGSHVRLVSTHEGTEHKITIPDHHDIKIGTLDSILHDVSEYLVIPKQELTQALFE